MPCAPERPVLKAVSGSRVVMTTCPAGPAGHRPARSSRLARSSRISAQGRRVCASQVMKPAAAASAPRPGSAAPTAPAAWANPVTIASWLLAETQTSASTARAVHSAWVNATASCVLPVPPCAAGVSGVSSPWVSTTVSPGYRPALRSSPVSGRWWKDSAIGGMLPDSRTGEEGGGAPARSATTSTAFPALPGGRPGDPGAAAP
jgi:hypothetical protein